jgi:hypothetical protein
MAVTTGAGKTGSLRRAGVGMLSTYTSTVTYPRSSRGLDGSRKPGGEYRA